MATQKNQNAVKDKRGPFDSNFDRLPCMEVDKQAAIEKANQIGMNRNDWLRAVINGEIDPNSNTPVKQ